LRARVCCVAEPVVVPAYFKEANIPGSYYAFYAKRLNFDKAREYCQSLHDRAHLVIIKSAEEQEAVAKFVKGLCNCI